VWESGNQREVKVAAKFKPIKPPSDDKGKGGCRWALGCLGLLIAIAVVLLLICDRGEKTPRPELTKESAQAFANDIRTTWEGLVMRVKVDADVLAKSAEIQIDRRTWSALSYDAKETFVIRISNQWVRIGGYKITFRDYMTGEELAKFDELRGPKVHPR
jgi:hypothetical protein